MTGRRLYPLSLRGMNFKGLGDGAVTETGDDLTSCDEPALSEVPIEKGEDAERVALHHQTTLGGDPVSSTYHQILKVKPVNFL